jgi:hypothetical protein
MSAIDIVMDEGILYPDKLHISDAEVKDPWTQFMALKVNIRTERNPTVRKAMISSGREGW